MTGSRLTLTLFGALILAVACGETAQNAVAPAPTAPESAVASSEAPVAPVAIRLDPLPLPGPGPRIRPEGMDLERANAGCGDCHRAIFAEWQKSLHHQAYDDPAFINAYAIEPTPFCFNCHAPEKGARHMGVGCITCHVQGTEVTGSKPSGQDTLSNGAVHAIRHDPRMSTVEACASCHQFEFPNVAGAFMQSTVNEHAGSIHKDRVCQDCHMPYVDDALSTNGTSARHRSHDFTVLANPDMLKKAVDISAERAGEQFVQVSLSTTEEIGHSFPTGDLFRRIEVRATAVDKNGNVIAKSDIKHLGRRYEVQRDPVHNTIVRIPRSDSRLPAPGAGTPRHVVLRFSEPIEQATIQWQVVYQRMDDGLAKLFGFDPRTDERIIASGEIPPIKRR